LEVELPDPEGCSTSYLDRTKKISPPTAATHGSKNGEPYRNSADDNDHTHHDAEQHFANRPE
jgi:hypothetical protein